MLQATEFCQRVLKPVLLPGRAFAQQLCRPSNRPCTRVRYYPDEPDVVRWQHERLPELVNLEETFSCKKDLDDFGFTCWMVSVLRHHLEGEVPLEDRLSHIVQQVLLLQRLCAIPLPSVPVEMIRRHPALMDCTEGDLVRRLVELKMMMPGADLAHIVRMKPNFLYEDRRCVDQIDRALKTMRKMMPHIDVEKKLGETDQHSSIWGSFNTLL